MSPRTPNLQSPLKNTEIYPEDPEQEQTFWELVRWYELARDYEMLPTQPQTSSPSSDEDSTEFVGSTKALIESSRRLSTSGELPDWEKRTSRKLTRWRHTDKMKYISNQLENGGRYTMPSRWSSLMTSRVQQCRSPNGTTSSTTAHTTSKQREGTCQSPSKKHMLPAISRQLCSGPGFLKEGEQVQSQESPPAASSGNQHPTLRSTFTYMTRSKSQKSRENGCNA